MTQQIRICQAPGCMVSFKTGWESEQLGCCLDHQKIAVGVTVIKDDRYIEVPKTKSVVSIIGTQGPGEQKKPSKEKESSTESSNVFEGLTQRRWSYGTQINENLTMPIQKKNETENESNERNGPMKNANEILTDALNTDAGIQNKPEPYGENGTSETERSIAKTSEQGEISETHSEDSIRRNLIAGMVESHSTSLIDDTATHLFSFIERVSKMTPSSDIRTMSPELLKGAVGAASQIRGLLKLKLDRIKMAMEVDKHIRGVSK